MKFRGRHLFTVLTIALALRPASRSQTTAPVPGSVGSPPTQLVVESFAESRDSAGAGSLIASVAVVVPGAPAGTIPYRVTLTQAEDDRGANLTPRNPVEFRNWYFDSDKTNPALHGVIRLQSPSRGAATIRVIAGIVEIFNPSDANGGIVRIRNLASHTGLVESPALLRHNLEVRRLDAENWPAFKASLPGGNSRSDPDFRKSLVIYLRDPSRVLDHFELRSQLGNPIAFSTLRNTGGPGYANGEVVQFWLDGPLPPDAQLVLYLTIPGAIQSVPFRAENIKLH